MTTDLTRRLSSLAQRINQDSPFGRWIDLTLLIAISVVMLAWRRPDQFTHPAIWVEEGPLTLLPYADRGWFSIFEPLGGYIVFVPKLIAFLSYSISIIHTPAIETGLTVIFIVTVLVSIWLSPTCLPWKMACALTPLFIPSDSEVFTVAEYAFWWAGLWVILPLFWCRDGQYPFVRYAILVIGGLSSPLVVPFALLYALRAAVERRKEDYIALGLVLLLAFAQILTMVIADADVGKTDIDFLTPYYLITKMLGSFLYWPLEGITRNIVAIIFASILLGIAFYNRRRLDRYFLMLIAVFAVVTGSVMMRIDEFIIHVLTGGPRYFFYAFIILMWGMIWLISVAPKPQKIFLAAVIAFAVIQAAPHFARYHDPIDWPAHLRACAASDTYMLPFHTYGAVEHAWQIKFTGAQCRSVMARSLIKN